MKKLNLKNRGMTYVEIIVVLAIFSVMTAVVIFNYGGFQAKVDIKNLASDIALKIVEAQKSALSGLLPPTGVPYSTWKPSYGVYFNLSTPKQFIYFADLNNNKIYDETALNTIDITRGNYISRIDSYVGSSPTLITNPLAITFKRPDSSAIFYSNGVLTGFDYIQITIASPKSSTGIIKVYPSGRIQVN
jgi:prepilin-type N-terminal cleavage/methylation domain-containing protein